MAALFARGGEIIGFDGSQLGRPAEIAATLEQVFSDHVTAQYVSKVRTVRFLSPDAALLRAVVGMVPVGQSDIDPQRNAHQTLDAVKIGGGWLLARRAGSEYPRSISRPAGPGQGIDRRAAAFAGLTFICRMAGA